MEERRHLHRSRTLRGARAVFHNGQSTMACVVRNLSPEGTLLRFESIVGLPDEFTLMFDDGAPGRACRVDHRHPDGVGVVFTDPAPK
jgi:hypothetical protein